MSIESRAAKSGVPLTPSLKAAITDGKGAAVMIGSGEAYLSPYAIFLQGAPFQLGVLTGIAPLVGAIGQILGLWALRFLTSRRNLIVHAALVNALIWIPIGLVTLISPPGPGAVWLLIALLCVYYLSAGLGNPAWNSLIGDLVPSASRGAYFGLRNRYIGLCTFAAMVLAGQVLDVATRLGSTGLGYCLVFFVAAASRMFSRYWLMRYEDPPAVQSVSHYFSFWQFISRSHKSNFARFVFYIAIINAAVAFSGPFFSVYMLRDLHFSYFQFTVAAAASTCVQFLTMQYWGKNMDQFGSKKVLNLLGFAVVFTPLLWLLHDSFWYIILVQFVNGGIWAGFNLAAATFLFDAVTPAKRARCTAYQAVVNGVAVAAGAIGGGVVAGHLPDTISFAGLEWTPASPLFLLFIISGLLRFAASVTFLPRFKEVSVVQSIRHRELLFRISGLRPISGMTFSIITEFPKRKKKRKGEDRAPERV